jgi:predicted nucleotidyltransferase
MGSGLFSDGRTMINPALKLSLPAIDQFCRKHRVRSLALFGSAIREDFRTDSDVDFLVEFADGAEPGLMELTAMEEELERLIGRSVDLVEKKAIEDSRNYIRRRHVLNHLETIYVAR